MNIRADFPFFTMYPGIAYLDNAASTQKPLAVIDAIQDAHVRLAVTPYRSIYTLAERATEEYERARAATASFIGAEHADEIAFVKSTTEGINAVAHAWGRANIVPGDEIIVGELEHHANLLPWQYLAEERGAILKWIRVNFDGTIDPHVLDELFTQRTKLIAITGYSNVLGSLDDIAGKGFLKSVIAHARRVGARVLIDAAQLVPYQTVDVQKLGCDFLAFSSNKMLGPAGVGVLYIKRDRHDELIPFMHGGGMVESVGYKDNIYRPFPYMLEAGTQSVPLVMGWLAALDYINSNIDMKVLGSHCSRLTGYAKTELPDIPRVQLLGPPEVSPHDHLCSFYVDGIHPHDVAAYLDNQGICVRAGNHCAGLLHAKLGIPASVRMSVYGYNTDTEVERLIDSLKKLVV